MLKVAHFLMYVATILIVYKHEGFGWRIYMIFVTTFYVIKYREEVRNSWQESASQMTEVTGEDWTGVF